jgi:uncharacterized protein with PhoU and TrkA domain
MWETFGPDVLVALIGAALTVAIAFATYVLNERRREWQALRSLVDELHHRRALTLIDSVRPVPHADELDDFLHVNASVLSIREEIRRTRDSVTLNSDLQRALGLMTRACNRYLETTAARPEQYLYSLSELRRELSEGVHALAATRRTVKVREPGDGAF